MSYSETTICNLSLNRRISDATIYRLSMVVTLLTTMAFHILEVMRNSLKNLSGDVLAEFFGDLEIEVSVPLKHSRSAMTHCYG